MREYTSSSPVDIPAAATITDVVFRRAAAEPGGVMLRKRTGAGSWQDVTARQFHAEVVALAKGLMAAGIEPGDRVGLLSRTRYEWALIDYAIWAAGAVTVPVYATSSAEQVAWILDDSAARAVFAETSTHEEIIGSVRGTLPRLAHLWMISDLDALASGGSGVTEEQLERRWTGRTAADLATIIYTSGTTGRPKGCELTHGNLLADVRAAVTALREIFGVPGCSTLLFPPAGPCVRAHHPGRLPGSRRDPRPLARHGDGRRRPHRVPAHVPALPYRGSSRSSTPPPGRRPR